MWAPKSCVLVTPGGKLPSVESRGDDLNGTAYPSVETADAFRNGNGISSSSSSGCGSFDTGDGNGTGSGDSSRGGSDGGSGSVDVVAAGTPIAAARSVTLRHDPGPTGCTTAASGAPLCRYHAVRCHGCMWQTSVAPLLLSMVNRPGRNDLLNMQLSVACHP